MNKKRLFLFLLSIVLVISAAICIALFTSVPIPISASDKIRVYTRNKPNIELTVAVIRGNETEIKAYGHDGETIPVPERSYELGQVTRTFTGTLVSKAIADGFLSLDTPVTDFITLASGAYVPSVYDLLTHSSAYSDYAPKISSFRNRNPYSGISGTDVVSSMNAFRLKYNAPYLYSDSDFGTAVLATTVSKVYDVDFYSILTQFIKNSLGLQNTYISVESTIANGWQWNFDDAYIANSGLTSDIKDMVTYARMYLNETYPFIRFASEPLYEVNAETSTGYFWTVSPKEWGLSQSGSTGHYSAAILIDKNKNSAVIVLSNYTDDRYGSTSDIAAAILQETEAAS